MSRWLPKLTVVRVAVLGVAIVLIPFGFLFVVSMRWAPGPLHDYASDLNRLSLAHQPGAAAQQNRWEDLLDLFEEMSKLRKTLEDRDTLVTFDELADRDNASMRARYANADGFDYDEQIALAERYIALLETRGIFDRIAELPEVRHAYPETTTGAAIWLGPPDFGETLLAFGQMGNAADMLSAMMADAGQRSDADRAIDLFEQSLAVSRLLSSPPLLIGSLHAIATESLTIERMRMIALEHRLNGEQLDRALRVLDEQSSLPMRYTLEAEFLMIADMLQRIFTDDGNGDGIIAMTAMNGAGFTGTVFEGAPKDAAMNMLGLFLPGKRMVSDRIGAYEQLLYDALDDHTIEIPDIAEFEATRGDVIMTLPFLRQMLPAKSAAVRNDRIRQSHRSAFRITIALERFHADQGSYPLSLGELTPKYIDELPPDPLTLGAAYRYEPPTLDGERYTLYSVGLNARDDHGKRSTQHGHDDIVFVEPVGKQNDSAPSR